MDIMFNIVTSNLQQQTDQILADKHKLHISH